jgi:bifunctional oligoribonuclease and PAP phosphatase NrnA
MEAEQLQQLRELLAKPKKILIFPHQRPDADALGSALALCSFLHKIGHQPTVVSPTEYPDFLKWMHGNDEVLLWDENTDNARIKGLAAEAELFFCLDFSDPKRTAPLDILLNENPQTPIVLIDHHGGKQDFAQFELWDIKAAATAQLIYDFIILLDGKQHIDIPIAECIYAGIMTDTGSFKHPSTNSHVHRIAAELLDAGLDSSLIHRRIFDTNSEDRLRLLGFVLNKRLCVLKQYKTAYIYLSKKDMQTYKTRTGDTEGVVNYALSVEGVNMAAIFMEYEKEIRISFRSYGEFSVANLARQHYFGGGHHNAAGGRLQGKKLKEVLEEFEKHLENYKDALTAY